GVGTTTEHTRSCSAEDRPRPRGTPTNMAGGQRGTTQMLTHPTYDRLLALGLIGMAKALEEQRRQRNVEGLSFEERLGLLVDREAVERESKRLVLRLKYANLRQSAVVEDLDTQAVRGLDKALFAKLAAGEWIARRQDLLITGKTGTGKSWLACALGHPVAMTARSSTIAFRACSMRWRSPAAMGAIHACSRASHAWSCWYSMIGGSRR